MHLGSEYTPEKLLNMLTPEQIKELQSAIEKYLADRPKSNNKTPDRN
jgi:hypothetical protein